MTRRLAFACLLGITLTTGNALAQPPEIAPASPAESLLRQPPAVALAEPEERLVHQPGWYAAGGVLVAPPIFFTVLPDRSGAFVLSPIPSPWAELGFRRANDVSWQVSTLLVPLHDPDGYRLATPLFRLAFGLDVDRISTNRSPWAALDLRWQVGVRLVGLGLDGLPTPLAIGPHAGLRLERPLTEGLTAYGWADTGLLPSLLNGIPLLDLRAELGLKWCPTKYPGLSLTVGAFNETIGFVIAGFMTPGIKVGLAWRF